MTRRSFCPIVIVLQYLSQKSTGIPVVGRGMIKLPKPLHFARIGAIAYAASKDECCYRKSSAGPFICDDEKEVQSLLQCSEEDCPLTFDLATKLWVGIAKIPKSRRPKLIKMLEPADISRMWDIAGYNNTDNNTGFLTHINENNLISPGSWRWKAEKKDIKEFVGLYTSNLKAERKIVRLKEFVNKVRLKDPWNFKMVFFGGSDGHMDGVMELKDQPCALSFIVKDVIGVKNQGETHNWSDPHLVFEVVRGKSHKRSDAKKVHDEAVENEILERQHRDDPKELPKPGEIYIRCAGPNVLVGKLRRKSKHSKEILVIKYDP